MINSVKARTPILALILFVFAVGYTFAANKVVVIPMAADAAPQSLAVFASGEHFVRVGSTDTTVRDVTLTAPSDGVVIVNSSTSVVESTEGDGIECSITTATTVSDQMLQTWESPGESAMWSQVASTHGFNVMGGGVYTFKLVCRHTGTDSTTNLFDTSITAIFTPSA